MKTTQLNFTQQNNSKSVFTLSKIFTLLFVLSFFALTSCGSDEKEDKEDKQPDGIALNKRFKDNRQDAIQEFNEDFCPGCTISVIGSKGTKVTFPPNSLGLNGIPITGNVTVELIEIYGKGAMVLQNMSTKGKKPNGDEEALNSAGEFFINARQNGTQLDVLSPINIESRPINPTDVGQMNIFKAGDNLDDEDLWREVDQDGDLIADIAEVGQFEDPVTHEIYDSFIFPVQDFGWTNLDRWYSFSGQLTNLFVDVEDEYNQTNSLVYLSYDGETGLAPMDTWDAGQQMFTEHYGRIPVGQEVHFIMLAEIDGVLHYAIQGATIVNGHIEVMPALQPTTQAQLTTLINALP